MNDFKWRHFQGEIIIGPIANHGASLPVACQLYLPENWASDLPRREKAGVPLNVIFATKPEIALSQIKAAFPSCLWLRRSRLGSFSFGSLREDNMASRPA